MKVSSAALFTGLASTSSVLVGRSDASAASAISSCCSSLESKLGAAKVISCGTTSYNASLLEYWSGQARDDRPACIVQPSSSADVAAAVTILTNGWCQFSIKSGGHAPWAGASSINNGIEIDMVNLSAVSLGADKTSVSMGPGARWGDVYDTLTSLGYGVAGGRDSSVGVGGLILGGGYSWFAASSGFVADSLVSVELVTADGKITTASATENPDLFLVLKGGGNNFGVVTNYEQKAFPFGNLWGGLLIYPRSTGAAQIANFVNFTTHIKDDEHANLINIWSYQQVTGLDLVINAVEYTEPIVDPAPYSELLAISPLIESTTRITNLTDLTNELEASTTQNERYLFITLTFELSAEMYQTAVDISDSYLAPYRNTTGLIWSLLFQPIPRVVSDASVAAGGNILGVDRNPGDLMLFLLYVTWITPEDDATFTKVGRECIADIKAAGAQLGVNVPFIYMNYGDQEQDVLGGYGAANREKLFAASQKYDPKGVFQNLVPGGWKLKSDHATS